MRLPGRGRAPGGAAVSAAADDLLFAGVAELSRRIRAREISPVDLAEACLSRIEALQPRLNCFVTVAAERARSDAREAEREIASGRWRGPLHGIPFALGDTIDTKGIPTTFGARPFADRVPDRDAEVAARLAAAGAVLAGKLSTIELGGALGYASAAAGIGGPCRNPWALSRWAGGASAGAAAAVAAGLVPFAMATDARGSLTGPCAPCGVTGLRPTYGTVSRRGVMAAAYTMDAVGAVARSAEDCALVLSAAADEDPRDPSSIAPPRGLDRTRPGIPRALRVGVLALPERPPPLPGAGEALSSAAEVLRGAGAIVERAALPELPFEHVASLLATAEAVAAHGDLVRSGRTRELSDPSHRGRGPESYEPRASAADYVRAMRARGEVQRALGDLFVRHDLLLAANLPWAPPAVGEPLGGFLGAPIPLVAAAGLAGTPALSVPVGSSGELPLAMLLVAPPGEEVRLLAAAALYQARTSHHLRRPEIAPGAAIASGAR